MSDFEEAVELLNWGLENRRMGKTAMNATSSRSHTVLTVNVRGPTHVLSLDGRDRAARPLCLRPHAMLSILGCW